MVFQFAFPSQTTVIGATQSGKTTLIKAICENTSKFFACPIDRIFWFSQSLSGVPNDDERVIAIEGPPDMNFIKEHRGKNSILVLDDLMGFFSNDKRGKDLLNTIFTVWAHHLNLSVFNLVQSAFQLDRTSRINSTYLILMKSHSDVLQMKTIFSQLFGEDFRRALEAYADAMETPYNHLLVDNHPMTDNRHRLLTDMTSDSPVVYVPRSLL